MFKPSHSEKPSSTKTLISALAALLVIAGVTGCAHPDQRHASLANKPNMQFADSDFFKCQNKLGSQIEPGSALSGGAKSAGQNCCH